MRFLLVTVFTMQTIQGFRFSANLVRPFIRGNLPRRMAIVSFEAPRNVLVPIASGSEEIETTCIADTLVRSGATVVLASVDESLTVTCSRGIKIVADRTIADCEESEWDLIVCPGGMPGAEHLRDSETLTRMLKRQVADESRFVAAVCAAPAVVLAYHGILQGKKATCYPAQQFTSALEHPVDEDVVIDGNVVTSRGPGTSLSFAIKLVETLYGAAKAKEISEQMLVPL